MCPQEMHIRSSLGGEWKWAWASCAHAPKYGPWSDWTLCSPSKSKLGTCNQQRVRFCKGGAIGYNIGCPVDSDHEKVNLIPRKLLLITNPLRWHVTAKLDLKWPSKQHQLNPSSQHQMLLRTKHWQSGLRGRNGAHAIVRVVMDNRPECERAKVVPLVPEIAMPITGKVTNKCLNRIDEFF